jgi:hypothetical protein
VGANRKTLNFPMVNAVQSLGSNGSYVQISGHGPNALDFHIAYYIGKLSSANPDGYFHIVSNDKGFDPWRHVVVGHYTLKASQRRLLLSNKHE